MFFQPRSETGEIQTVFCFEKAHVFKWGKKFQIFYKLLLFLLRRFYLLVTIELLENKIRVVTEYLVCSPTSLLLCYF